MSNTVWSEEQVKAMLQENNFSYQKIDLPFGLSTKGADRSSTAKKIFPDDMTGKTVLDIGCKQGFFCFEALKRGATKVLGIDVDPESIKKARLLADCLGVEASFELLDIETDPIHEKFDYVLCLNVLHHLNNPIAVLDKLAAITRERVILEVAGLGQYDSKKLKVPFLARFFLKQLPVVFVASSGKSGRPNFQKFLITPSAIEHIFMCQRGAFARVDHIPSDHHNRNILVIHKRKVRNIVVVAGLLVTETSAFIARLQSGALPKLSKRLGIEDMTSWTVVVPDPSLKKSGSYGENLIFQYDLLRPFVGSAKVHKRDHVLETLNTGDHLTFLTLWHSPSVLQEIWAQHQIRQKKTFGLRGGGKKRTQLLQRVLKDPSKIRAYYQSWFEFTKTKSSDHLVVLLENGVHLYSLEEWETNSMASESTMFEMFPDVLPKLVTPSKA